jgi:hypothetical protein
VQWGALANPVFEENGNYNALQGKFEARNFHGLNLLGSYAYSKCIDYTTDDSGTPIISLWRFYRAVCDSDLPHAFSGSYDYQLPVGSGKRFLGGARGFVNQALGGARSRGSGPCARPRRLRRPFRAMWPTPGSGASALTWSEPRPRRRPQLLVHRFDAPLDLDLTKLRHSRPSLVRTHRTVVGRRHGIPCGSTPFR